MKKLAISISISALAAGLIVPNVVLAKGGQGRGHGGHFAMMRGHASPPGWSHGRKVGWRGLGCPPGLAKQGRC